jgi:hypothetical protein
LTVMFVNISMYTINNVNDFCHSSLMPIVIRVFAKHGKNQGIRKENI